LDKGRLTFSYVYIAPMQPPARFHTQIFSQPATGKVEREERILVNRNIGFSLCAPIVLVRNQSCKGRKKRRKREPRKTKRKEKGKEKQKGS